MNRRETRKRTRKTPDVEELRRMKVSELQEKAKELGVSGRTKLRKDELVEAVATATRGDGRGAKRQSRTSKDSKASKESKAESGGVRTGRRSSKSLQYAQEVKSPDDEPERPGRTLVTTDHDVIRRWAEERKATPATVPGTEHGDHLGVLRFDFPGYGGKDLRHIDWDEWFDTFDSRRLNFIYQEKRKDGRPSNFFRLENPDREDA